MLDIPLRPEMIIERSAVRSGDQILVEEKSWLARIPDVIMGASISAEAIILTAILR